MTKEERETKTYTISNSDAAPRDVIIEHPARPEWKLADGAKPEETTASLLSLPRESGTEKGRATGGGGVSPSATRVELSDVSDDEITLLTEQKRMTPALQQAIKRVLDQKAVIDAFDMQIKSRQQEMKYHCR